MSSTSAANPFQAQATFTYQGAGGPEKATYFRLAKLQEDGLAQVDRLPYSIRILLESVLRNCDEFEVTRQDVLNLATWEAAKPAQVEIPFKPSRVVLQDFTGVPAVVDLAAMRSAMQRLGGNPKKINPLVPVDLVIDHSVQVDYFGTEQSLQQNVELEFERNQQRYEFLRWGQEAFDNFRVVPPNVGIVHQVNLEFLAKGVFLRPMNGQLVALPDTLVGTDSHTTMINGLGVLGWGVGGIEAEAAMLGQPIYMLMPEVIGFEVVGQLPAGTTATDMVLTVTQILRKAGVVGKFVEFFGSGYASMSLADRATIANMAPEYGATMGFFPVDEETLNYLRRTGRTAAEVSLVENYYKSQGLFYTPTAPQPIYSQQLKLDLSTIRPSLAGPKRPQDRVALTDVKSTFRAALTAPIGPAGYALPAERLAATGTYQENGSKYELQHGAVAIAAITSCTNTSNPSVLVAAGLVAKAANERGMKVPPYVKTSLAPGSRVVTDYLNKANLSQHLDDLGFQTVGYGCTTCIGNSGPLPDAVAKAITDGDLVAAAVLSGNRNFEGRVSPQTKANYLASPPLVVAYALAGTVDIDFASEPLGKDRSGQPVMLADLWPTRETVAGVVAACITPEMFTSRYAGVFKSNETWNQIPVTKGELYQWQEDSTYIHEPPFMAAMTSEAQAVPPIKGARVLLALGDSVTTDHISPAGSIGKDSPAGRYLISRGVEPRDFNSYGSRRGDDRVMVRGTFANIRIRNQVAPGTEGGWSKLLTTGEVMSVYDASMAYQQAGIPLVILAGAEYGTGSSRDWAAKGTMMLGVKAVMAASYERIHRSNLVGMGILPLQFPNGSTWQSLGLTGEEIFDFPELEQLKPLGSTLVVAKKADGTEVRFQALVRIDTPVELVYYQNGGILPTVVRKLL
ncbi:MAG: aconitate hydratase AcnA [Planctomycetaceae bacterium]|nr:aconitate hydratase AcnA [Planctomycetaceae bacterium]